MAYQFSVNNASTADYGAQVLFAFKALAKANGWTVTRSSDGTTAGAGDNIANVAAMKNAWSWFVIQGPNGREWLISHSGTAGMASYHVAYSVSAGFTGGTNSADPTATDQHDELGTAGAAVSGLMHIGNYYHLMVDDAADTFYMICAVNGTAVVRSLWFAEELSEGVTGDTDLCVMGTLNQASDVFLNTCFYDDNDTQVKGPQAVLDTTGTPTLKRVAGALLMANGVRLFPHDGANGVGVNNDDGDDPTIPLTYGRSSDESAPYGYKGMSSIFRPVGTGRAAGDTLTRAVSRDYVVFGAYRTAVVWEPGTTPLI